MNATAPPAPPEPPGPQPPGPPPLHRVLRRDRSHRVLGGVAAGIARTYGLDVTLVRVLWIVAGVFWIGIPAYVIAWIVIPADDGSAALSDQPRDLGLLGGLALIGLGTFIAAGTLLPNFWHGGRFAAPLLLIGGGALILWVRRPSPDGPSADDSSPDDTDPAVNALATEATPRAEAPTAPAPPSTPVDPARTPTTTAAAEPASAWTQTAPWPTARDIRRTARADRRAQRPRPFLGPLTVSVLLIGAGVTALLQSTGVVDVNLTVAFAIATGFVGAVLVLSAWFGRARGLVFLGLLLIAATAVASVIDVPLRGGIGAEHHRPTTIADIRSPYRLGIGHLRLDLRAISYPAGVTDIEASVGIGRLEVDVPSSVDLVVDGHTGAGAVNVFDRKFGGFDRDAHERVTGDGPGLLHLKLRVGAGEIDVHRFDARGFETLIGEQP